MTAAQRTRIRTAIDQHARAQRDAAINAGTLTVCFECETDLDTYTRGCGRCQDRRSKQRQKARNEARDTAATMN